MSLEHEFDNEKCLIKFLHPKKMKGFDRGGDKRYVQYSGIYEEHRGGRKRNKEMWRI